MLRCPKCNRTYQDDMQKFCTHDGGRLVPDLEQAKPFDPNATVHADLSNLDIPVTPPAPPAPAPNLNATLAGTPPPPVPQPTTPQPPSQPTTNFRSSETGPTSFPQTTRLTPPSAPPPQNYQTPPAQPPAQQPPPPAPPVSQPNAPQQLPTLAGPPPTPSGGFPSSSTGAPSPSAGLPNQSAGLPSQSASAPISSAALPNQSAALPIGSTPLPSQSAPLPGQSASAPLPSAPLPAAKKKSKVGLILALVAVLFLLIVAVGGVGGYLYWKRSKTVASNANNGGVTVNQPLETGSNSNNNSTTTTSDPKLKPKVEAPPNSVKFENSASNLDGKLAERYVDFYFYYPQTWQKSAKAGVPGASNFAEVERFIPPDYTQEKLVVGYYLSKGTVEADLAGKLPDVIKEQDAKLAKSYPEYQKVSEGKTTINGIDGYEFRFKAMSRNTEKGDITFWGRVVFLPPGDEQSNKGVTLYMLTTSLAPELQSVDDVGIKGELPVILNSFTLGKS
jgi:flagellar basal body-associated protein FliL